MRHKKATPVVFEASNENCPVCGKRTYSRSGIHPQCAVRQADALSDRRRKEMEKLQTPKPKKSPWKSKGLTQKTCPKCNVQRHVRVKQCECGHNFFAGV